jgi:tryptophan synthase beta chain
MLKDAGRAEYVSVEDKDVLDTFHLFTKLEGIIPALESTHALTWLVQQKGKFSPETTVIVNLSGRGDKDVGIVEEHSPV